MFIIMSDEHFDRNDNLCKRGVSVLCVNLSCQLLRTKLDIKVCKELPNKLFPLIIKQKMLIVHKWVQ